MRNRTPSFITPNSAPTAASETHAARVYEKTMPVTKMASTPNRTTRTNAENRRQVSKASTGGMTMANAAPYDVWSL